MTGETAAAYFHQALQHDLATGNEKRGAQAALEAVGQMMKIVGKSGDLANTVAGIFGQSEAASHERLEIEIVNMSAAAVCVTSARLANTDKTAIVGNGALIPPGGSSTVDIARGGKFTTYDNVDLRLSLGANGRSVSFTMTLTCTKGDDENGQSSLFWATKAGPHDGLLEDLSAVSIPDLMATKVDFPGGQAVSVFFSAPRGHSTKSFLYLVDTTPGAPSLPSESIVPAVPVPPSMSDYVNMVGGQAVTDLQAYTARQEGVAERIVPIFGLLGTIGTVIGGAAAVGSFGASVMETVFGNRNAGRDNLTVELVNLSDDLSWCCYGGTMHDLNGYLAQYPQPCSPGRSAALVLGSTPSGGFSSGGVAWLNCSIADNAGIATFRLGLRYSTDQYGWNVLTADASENNVVDLYSKINNTTNWKPTYLITLTLASGRKVNLYTAPIAGSTGSMRFTLLPAE